MRLLYLFLVVILMLGCGSSLTSPTSPEKALIGAWTFVGVGEKGKDEMHPLNPSDGIGGYLIFKRDKTFEEKEFSNKPFPDKVRVGTYSLEENILTLVYEEQSPHKKTIKFKDDLIVLTALDTGSFFEVVYLRRTE